MKTRRKLWIGGFLVLAGLAAGYQVWAASGRQTSMEPLDLHLKGFSNIGEDSGNGNILAIQPWMVPADYLSEAAFNRKLSGYLVEARNRHLLNNKTVVVLPEGFGFWLVVCGEKSAVAKSKSVDEAMKLLVASNIPAFAKSMTGAKGADKTKDALFRMKARKMAKVYQDVLSGLARSHGITIVGGSILLPTPSVVNGVLTPGDGPLVNVTPVFRKDGSLEPNLVVKCFPTTDELPFIARGKVDDLPVFDTPAGKVGVLVCADAWYPETHARLKEQNVAIIVSPSYIAHDGLLDNTWCGYSGRENPPDVAPTDPFRIKEMEAILRYGLPGRLELSGAQVGVASYLRGHLWDMGADGGSFAVGDGIRPEIVRDDCASFLNLWL